MKNNKEIYRKVLLVIEGMLSDDIDPVEGARFIVDNRFLLDSLEDVNFTFFIAFVSETEDVPVGICREKYSENYLSDVDDKQKKYMSRIIFKLKYECETLKDKIIKSLESF